MNPINQSTWRWALFGLPVLTAHATIFSSLSQIPEASHPTEDASVSIELDITEFTQPLGLEVCEEPSPSPLATETQTNDIEETLREQAIAQQNKLEESEERERQKLKNLAEKNALKKAEALAEDLAKKQRQLAQEEANKKAAEKKRLAKQLAEKKAAVQKEKQRKLAAEQSRKAALAKKIVKSPTVSKRINPRYPKTLQRKNIEGIVKLSLKINAGGSISSISISQSSGHSAFDSAALSAVKKWTYTPAKNGLGQQVSCRKKETVIFRLQ